MSDAALTAEAAAERPTIVRWLVLLLAGLLAIVIYIHRSCIAAASTTIEADLAISDTAMGWVKAAFSCGYFFQFLGAVLNSRFGNRLCLVGMATASSAAMIGVSQAHSVSALWVSMACIGLAQAGIIPCVGQIVREWVPADRRATAGSVFTSSMSIGSAVASGMTGALLDQHLSWRLIFGMYTLLGLVWAAVFYVWFRDHPSQHPGVNASELRLIQGEGPPAAPSVPPRADFAVWRVMLTNRNQWFNCCQQFFRNFAYTFFITWYPAFLENAYHVSKKEAGLMNMVPLLSVVVGGLAGGQLIDYLLRRTGHRYLSRSVTAAAGHLIYAGSILAASAAPTPWWAAICIGFGMMFFGIGSPATWAVTMDIAGKYTTLFFAFMNATGVVAGVICPIVVGVMTDRIKQSQGDWNDVLYLFAAINVCATICWLSINSKHPANLPE